MKLRWAIIPQGWEVAAGGKTPLAWCPTGGTCSETIFWIVLLCLQAVFQHRLRTWLWKGFTENKHHEAAKERQEGRKIFVAETPVCSVLADMSKISHLKQVSGGRIQQQCQPVHAVHLFRLFPIRKGKT